MQGWAIFSMVPLYAVRVSYSGGGGWINPSMNLTWGDILPSTCFFGEKNSGFENLITLS
jgi:hypothetical protein